MDTITKKDADTEIRALECAEVMSRIAPVLADYLDHGDINASGGRFDELYRLAWAIEREQTYIPLLEHRQAQIVAAVAGVYHDVRKGKIVNEDQQRDAHEGALKRIDVLPRSPSVRKEILDRLVQSSDAIKATKDRSGGGPREAAKVVVGQLRPRFFGLGVRWLGLPQYATVVARDAMDDLCRRAEERQEAKRSPRTMRTILRVLIDSALDAFLDYDLLTEVQDAVRNAIEKQVSRDSAGKTPRPRKQPSS